MRTKTEQMWIFRSLHRSYSGKTAKLLENSPRQYCDNIFENERQTIGSLKNNSNVVIKKADKSSTIVILDKNEYITEPNKQCLIGTFTRN